MKLAIQKLNKIYPLAIWALGVAVLFWSLWLAYQHINRAVFNPTDAINSINVRQHKLNKAAFDKVIAAWQAKKAQVEADTPLMNPFSDRP